MDFTLKIYKKLLTVLKENGYQFYTYNEFSKYKPNGKFIILRHDIDKKPNNALAISQIEFELGIKSSFYFKISDDVFKPDIIKKIASLGHEIGYHYRDLVDSNGDMTLAINQFKINLENFRKIIPVHTIVMDGCPLSKYDNRNLWLSYNYSDFGIVGEPYFDINFDEVFYITDTGRCWNGYKFNIRDKVNTKFKLNYHNTSDIIESLKNATFPEKVMITSHPQRWTNNLIYWGIELISQNFKNLIKQMLNKRKIILN